MVNGSSASVVVAVVLVVVVVVASVCGVSQLKSVDVQRGHSTVAGSCNGYNLD